MAETGGGVDTVDMGSRSRRWSTVSGAENEALVDEPHCEECSRIAPRGARGWRVETGADGLEILYCPACWEREFGAGEPETSEAEPPVP